MRLTCSGLPVWVRLRGDQLLLLQLILSLELLELGAGAQILLAQVNPSITESTTHLSARPCGLAHLARGSFVLRNLNFIVVS